MIDASAGGGQRSTTHLETPGHEEESPAGGSPPGVADG